MSQGKGQQQQNQDLWEFLQHMGKEELEEPKLEDLWQVSCIPHLNVRLWMLEE
jgi:hypothetical protein